MLLFQGVGNRAQGGRTPFPLDPPPAECDAHFEVRSWIIKEMIISSVSTESPWRTSQTN